MGSAYFPRSKTMNIKLHTPKSLQAGSGMSSMKQFLLSILATTVSIALTFGTAAIIDHNKKQKEKREIVMMVMYDMYNSLKSIEKADTILRQSMEIQRQLAEDTTLFDKMKANITRLVPMPSFTETTEHIFSSNIETINTVGNVLFTENVAEFYKDRQLYATNVCDTIRNKLVEGNVLTDLKSFLDFNYFSDALLSHEITTEMQHLFAQCKQMMGVTDEEIESYHKEREQMNEGLSDNNEAMDSAMKEYIQLQEEIDNAKKKLKLEQAI